MGDSAKRVTADDLTPPRYELLADLTHAQLGEFVLEYFFRRRSWLVWAHHAMSLATLAAIVFVAIDQRRSFLRCLGDFGLAFVALFVVILPCTSSCTPSATASWARATSAGTIRRACSPCG